jgi:histone acetyltransferase (RNA polymerase elongator complex component)
VVRHYNIPVFIPEMACPHRCVFCNQETITGFEKAPDPKEVKTIVGTYLSTIPQNNVTDVRIAFFGGSFTGLPLNIQEDYLAAVQEFIGAGVAGIRLSTRPDYISEEILSLLKRYNVTHVELGAQSLDNEVLRRSGRGHTAEDVFNASRTIIENGFILGLQMMLGLPGDNPSKAMATARSIVGAGAAETRIYPTLVIRNTALEKLWKAGKYKPLSLEEAVEQAAAVYEYFNDNGVKVLRTGLYPSEELVDNSGFLAGPFHPAFKELVMTAIWKKRLENLQPESPAVKITVAERVLNYVSGYKKSNLKLLLTKFRKVKFSVDNKLKDNEFRVDYM